MANVCSQLWHEEEVHIQPFFEDHRTISVAVQTGNATNLYATKLLVFHSKGNI